MTFWKPSDQLLGRKRLRANRYRRILIVATRQIGDVLCTTPLIRRAREVWPNAVIDVLGYEKTMGMLKGNPLIDEVIESSEHPRWSEYRVLLRRIFRKYDLAIVTQPSDRAHLYGLMAAPHRVGIVPSRLDHSWWKNAMSMATLTMDGATRHVVVDRARLIHFFDQTESPPRLDPPEIEGLPLPLGDWLINRRVIVIHATPMWRYKQWPSERWARLIHRLVSQGLSIVLTGSSSSTDKAMNEEILRLLPDECRADIYNAAGTLSLGQVTDLMTKACLYLGVDTSITHQAAAVGLPVLAIFGPTTPVNFGPWPKGFDWSIECDSPWSRQGSDLSVGHRFQNLGNVTIIQGPGGCVPCMKGGCEDHVQSHSQCLIDLDERVILKQVDRLLGEALQEGHAA